MNAAFFSAQWSVLARRWPWAPEEKEAMTSFRERLKARVLDLDPVPFAEAVERLVARDWNNRPSVEQVAAEARKDTAHAAIRASAAAKDAVRREADDEAWRASCEARRADPELRKDAVRRIRIGTRLWAPGSRQRRVAVEWLRDFWGEPIGEREYGLLVSAPRAALTRSRDRKVTEPARPFREPGEDG